ncbi:MAG TPA: D-glycero-beta-D-manno-heptose-7-phosphate kinase [Bacteroidota bacterium]|nr:D-glycero-beta-D-manno-heptose-7-phosphate kinase [Bacteroidota bacterium]
MVTFSETRLKELLSKFKNKRIAVIGDVMVDKYLWGSVGRISPEAPVPIVEVEKETERLGGAANVANNIKSLGGEPVLVGVVGDDADGDLLTKLLAGQNCPISGIVKDPSRPTTVKTRVIAHGQHVVRIDNEQKRDISPSVQEQILSILRNSIASLDGIILEDYNKGVITASLIHHIIEMARGQRKIVTVDPKFQNFFEYKNASVFKPNRKEVEEALGMKLATDESLREAIGALKEKLNAENILITRGEQGMSLLDDKGSLLHLPTRAQHVADVSGAGDTVIATLTMAMASGASIYESASLANFAGGVVCGEVGIVPILPDALLARVLSFQS